MGQLSVIGSIVYYVCTFGLSGLICRYNIQNKYVKLLLVSIPPVILATFRYNVGYDYGSYVDGYRLSFGTTYASIFEDYEIGSPLAFNLITKFATIFNSDRVFLMILAFLALVPGLSYILREWDFYDIQPLMVFVFLFNTFIFSLSACKQGIAVSILGFSLQYVYDRKPIKFAMCIAVASLFHSTAIVFVFVYFFLNKNGDLSTFKKILIVVACILVIINLEALLGSIMEGRYEDYATSTVEGANRTFWLYSLMTILFLLFRKQLVKIDKRNELLIMMMVIGSICQYLGFFNAFTKRIGEYFLIAQVFLIPQCIYLFTEDSRRLVKLLIVVYTIAIFFIGYPVASSGMGFIPYQFKLM
ncbi:EpsG family protein [Faecalimonas umbilicata]|nr:EpsG family protein [Faecalimonas umbilicata]